MYNLVSVQDSDKVGNFSIHIFFIALGKMGSLSPTTLAFAIALIKHQLNQKLGEQAVKLAADALSGSEPEGSILEKINTFLEDTESHPVPFGGRESEIESLDRWLNDPDHPYFLVIAPSGRGKSARLVRWLAHLTRREMSGTHIAFVPISVRARTNLANVFLSALALRLAMINGENLKLDPETPAEVWAELCA